MLALLQDHCTAGLSLAAGPRGRRQAPAQHQQAEAWVLLQAAREAEARELCSVLDSLWELLEVPQDDLARQAAGQAMQGPGHLQPAQLDQVCRPGALDASHAAVRQGSQGPA